MKPHVLKLRSRFSIIVAAGVLLVSALMGVVTFFEARRALLEARHAELVTTASFQASKVALRMTGVADRPLVAATALELAVNPSEAQVAELIKSILGNSPDIFGMAVAYEPHAFQADRRLFAPYYYRGAQGYETVALEASYFYPDRDWYKIPLLLGRPVWSEPYFDEGGGDVLMSTYSVPMTAKGKKIGVLTADVSLKSLERQVSELTVGHSGWAFVISASGSFLAAPRSEWIMRESVFSLAEASKRDDLRALGRKMIAGNRGVERIDSFLDGKPVWLAFAPVEGVGWSFGVAIPEDEVLAPVWGLARRQAMAVAGGLTAMVLVVWLLVVGLTKPLRHLSSAAQRLASGDLATKVDDVRPGDEIGDLAASFNTMVDDLRRHVQNLTATTAAKERIQSELDMAYQIQQSILPRTYPAFPERPELDLFARTIPAREVGGDFYDFFMLGEDRVGLVVGDVSGKGVPAALFMTVARTLIKNAATHNAGPMDVLNEVNAQIVPENEMCMFVTVFYGIYNLKTGELDYTCAGHPSPMLRRADGKVERMEQTPGMVVGVLDDLDLIQRQAVLQPGDTMVAFTDGLDESINLDQEMFGMARATQWFDTVDPTLSAPDVIESLIQCQAQFIGGADKFDDLTLLVLRRKF